MIKINAESDYSVISPDNKELINVNRQIQIFDLENHVGECKAQFFGPKNCARAALSSDQQLLAYSNTSGHLFLLKPSDGKLLYKSKALNDELCSLSFLPGDRTLLISTISGYIATVEASNGKVKQYTKTPYSSVELYPTKDPGIFIGIGFRYSYAYLMKIFIQEQIDFQLVKEINRFYVETINTDANGDICIISGKKRFLSHRYALLKYDICNNQFVEVLDLAEGIKMCPKFGTSYWVGLSFSDDGKIGVFYTNKHVLLYRFDTNKWSGCFMADYVSDVHLTKNQLIICTWEKIIIKSYEEIFQA